MSDDTVSTCVAYGTGQYDYTRTPACSSPAHILPTAMTLVWAQITGHTRFTYGFLAGSADRRKTCLFDMTPGVGTMSSFSLWQRAHTQHVSTCTVCCVLSYPHADDQRSNGQKVRCPLACGGWARLRLRDNVRGKEPVVHPRGRQDSRAAMEDVSSATCTVASTQQRAHSDGMLGMHVRNVARTVAAHCTLTVLSGYCQGGYYRGLLHGASTHHEPGGISAVRHQVLCCLGQRLC